MDDFLEVPRHLGILNESHILKMFSLKVELHSCLDGQLIPL